MEEETLGAEHWEKTKHSGLEELVAVMKAKGFWNESVHKALYQDVRNIGVHKKRVNTMIGGTLKDPAEFQYNALLSKLLSSHAVTPPLSNFRCLFGER